MFQCEDLKIITQFFVGHATCAYIASKIIDVTTFGLEDFHHAKVLLVIKKTFIKCSNLT